MNNIIVFAGYTGSIKDVVFSQCRIIENVTECSGDYANLATTW